MKDSPPVNARPLSLLSVIIPAQNEAGCIVSTIEHLQLELRLHNVPHEIVVVEDGSTDNTWELLTSLQAQNEASCIVSTIEHLQLELRLHNVPHEIETMQLASF